MPVHWQIYMTLGEGEFNTDTLRPRQNGRHFADDVFKCIFLNDNVWILHQISLKFVPKGPINNIPSFVQIMAWRRPGDKPLSEPMMVSLLPHLCVARPQWVKFCFRIECHIFYEYDQASWMISQYCGCYNSVVMYCFSCGACSWIYIFFFCSVITEFIQTNLSENDL